MNYIQLMQICNAADNIFEESAGLNLFQFSFFNNIIK